MTETSAATPESGAAPQASPEDRIAAILGKQGTASADEAEPAPTDAAPEQPQQDATAEGQPLTDKLTADDLPDDVQAEAAPSGDEFEIVHNGQQRKLSREETIKLAQQGFDYTQKTQQLAEAARSVSERMQRLQEVEQVSGVLASELATVKAFEAQLQRFNEVNWVQLATDDPLEYPRYRAQYDQLMQGYQAAAQQYGQKQQAVQTQLQRIRADMLAQEVGQLPKLIPQWQDQAKFAEGQKDIVDYIRSAGYDPAQLAGRYLDNAFSMATAWKAAQYDKLQKAKGEKSKLMRNAPPVVKPGASQPAVSARAETERKAQDRLRKSGDLRDAAAVLLNRLK
jgi:hypothetical protein